MQSICSKVKISMRTQMLLELPYTEVGTLLIGIKMSARGCSNHLDGHYDQTDTKPVLHEIYNAVI